MAGTQLPPSRAAFCNYFRHNEDNPRFQNSGWVIANHLRWMLLYEFNVHVETGMNKIGVYMLACAVFVILPPFCSSSAGCKPQKYVHKKSTLFGM